jgi:hypothetical protein
VSTPVEELERRIDELRGAVRRAAAAGDRARARQLRSQLRAAESAWDDAVAELEFQSAQPGSAPRADAASQAGGERVDGGLPHGGLPGAESDGGPAGAESDGGLAGAGRDAWSAGAEPDGGLAGAGRDAGLAGAGRDAGLAGAGRDAGLAGAGRDAGLAGAGPDVELSDAETDDSRPRANGTRSLLPIREQVHQALTLIGVPAAPKLIVAVHDAFFSGPLVAARLTSIRRDEERSFRTAPHARAYYLCAALTADLLAPARGLLAVSTWPLELRVIGPLSPRVDYLTAAIAVADSVRRLPAPTPDATRLLWRFAVNIPGAHAGGRRAQPGLVAEAARAELTVHQEQDRAHRQAAAARAQAQLDEAGQLFGSRLAAAGRTAASW